MFGIDWQELLVIVFVAVVVIGPKDLPRAMRTAGKWIGKIRRTSNHFRAGIETMIREAELEEMEKKWGEQNARIMAENAHGRPVRRTRCVRCPRRSPRWSQTKRRHRRTRFAPAEPSALRRTAVAAAMSLR